jgi:hypothetical protein
MVNFEEIKQVRITDLLGRYHVPLKFRGKYAMARCPLPSHKPNDKDKNFSVNVEQNYWRCFSASCNAANGGKRGGDVINLVALLENCTNWQAAQKIAEWYGLNRNGDCQPAKPRLTSDRKTKENAPHMEERAEKSPKETSQKDYQDNNPRSDSVKSRYMEELDKWFDGLIGRHKGEDDAVYWKRIRNGVKAKLIESYRNGKRAQVGLAPESS